MSRWVLFDDPGASRLRPFTWLRPASALLIGAETLEQRWRRLAGPDPIQVACRRVLVPLKKNRIDWRDLASKEGDRSGEEIWVSDLVVPAPGLLEELKGLRPDEVLVSEEGSVVGFRRGSRTSGLLARAAGTPPSPMPEAGLAEALQELARLGGGRTTPAQRTGRLSDLIRWQPVLLQEDLERLVEALPEPPDRGEGAIYAPERVRIGRGCRIDAGAVLDAREGPIVLEEGCRVFPHTWLRGPLYAGRDCLLLGGKIGGGSSLGPVCRVQGEVESSILLGYDNKAHDGFVGHSVLGEWVNLGAMTTTSDLKNNYGAISLKIEGVIETTGLNKLGVFFGDHVKTRIGSLITCGTVIGIGASLIGEPAVSERWIADFSWGHGPDAEEYAINKFLGTAETVFGRRSVSWTEAEAAALREAFEATRESRLRQIGGGRQNPRFRADEPSA